jgi:hypothetical protein
VPLFSGSVLASPFCHAVVHRIGGAGHLDFSKRANIKSHTSAAAQRQFWRRTMFLSPNSSGKSRLGEPVRVIKRDAVQNLVVIQWQTAALSNGSRSERCVDPRIEAGHRCWYHSRLA